MASDHVWKGLECCSSEHAWPLCFPESELWTRKYFPDSCWTEIHRWEYFDDRIDNIHGGSPPAEPTWIDVDVQLSNLYVAKNAFQRLFLSETLNNFQSWKVNLSTDGLAFAGGKSIHVGCCCDSAVGRSVQPIYSTPR